MGGAAARRKLALVLPWFGRELKGGAEQQAWQVAARLARRGHAIDVLTTCCRSHQDDWTTNHLPDGVTDEPEGFSVRRFPVDPRDREAFDRVAGVLMNLGRPELHPGLSPVPLHDSQIFTRELIKSRALLDYLKAHKEAYDRFILLPYLYGPVIDGVRITGERAMLQPCLHDEGYAYLPEVREAFDSAGLLLFNSEGERELALRLFGPGIWHKSVLVGEGVEVTVDAARERQSSNGDGRYLLYLGRKESGKNTDLLVRAFARFAATRPNSDLRLVLAGIGAIDFPACERIVDLGLVSDERKHELLRNCVGLVQPSEKESFSRVMMEAWLHGKPVAAHARCLATALAVERSGGGWLAAREEEWANVFARFNRATPDELLSLGTNGQRYAREFADWDRVMERYEGAFALPPQPFRAERSAHVGKAIHQVLPNLSYGDAISNEAVFIRDFLRARGYESNIYVRYIDPPVAHECVPFEAGAIEPSAGIIYHHSIGTELTPHVIDHPGPKCLRYHNITPAEFFEPYAPDYAQILRHGRDELQTLARHFPISCGVSPYNADELAAYGFQDPRVLAIAVDPGKWSTLPDAGTLATLQDGRTNLLFVGRLAPNKKQDDLVKAFAHYLSFDPTARLILIGGGEEPHLYPQHVRDVIAALRLKDAVIMPGNVSDAELAAYYRSAHLFWSMSEHEGFCVPLLEAMWFDVPVLAYASSAIPETLGSAGLMFTDKANLLELAALAHLLVTDELLREAVLQAQRLRRLKFLPSELAPALDALAGQLVPA